MNYFLLYYREHKLDTTYVYAGIAGRCGRSATRRTERKMAVLTNKPVRASRDILAGLGLAGNFFQVMAATVSRRRNPIRWERTL